VGTPLPHWRSSKTGRPWGSSVIPAPPCKKQGPFASVGKGSTTSSDYPRVFPDPRPSGR